MGTCITSAERDDEAQFLFGVELQAQQDAEARAQRRLSRPGRVVAPMKVKGDLHHVGARRRALADDDVELVVLERGVELFFEHRLHAVNLVEEEHLALAQVGEDGGQVALDLQGRAGGLLEADVELVGDDGGQRGLAQAGGPKSSTWSSASPRDLAASSAMASCSLALDWPMNSRSQRGRSLSSKPCSSSAREALTSRSLLVLLQSPWRKLDHRILAEFPALWQHMHQEIYSRLVQKTAGGIAMELRSPLHLLDDN
jgi:hypothetical protein